jgi:hypothetical protein
MPPSEPNDSPHRYRYGEYCVEFVDDPKTSLVPRRTGRLRRGWEWIGRWLGRIPGVVIYAALGLTAAYSISTAFYPEKAFVYWIAAGLTVAGTVVARRVKPPMGLLGIGFLVLGGTLWLALAATSVVPELSRGFAVAYAVQRGGQLAVFGHAEFDSANRFMQSLTGRDLWVSDIVSVRGPLEAFPPAVVRDLNVPDNVPIYVVAPSEETGTDWSSHVRAIASQTPMLNGSWMNESTLIGLSRSPLRCDLLLFDEVLTEGALRLLRSPSLRYATLRLHRIGPEEILKLSSLKDTGRTLGNVYLSDCDLDLASAKVLADLQAQVVLDGGRQADDSLLAIDDLDALVQAQVSVQKVITSEVDRERAARLAQLPSLAMLQATLTDEDAVERLSNSALEVLEVAQFNPMIVASLLKYPKLGFVTFQLMDGEFEFGKPLFNKPEIYGIHARIYRGTAKQIARFRRQGRATVGEVQELPEPSESTPTSP